MLFRSVFNWLNENTLSYFTSFGAHEIDAVVGDLNQDGSLDVTDAVLLGKAAAGAVELSAAQKSSADVNHDGTVDSSDTVKLMQFLVRLVDTL